jgi:CelD/BcsL family acetyltransferase involved in cellulose biosynthesis
MLSLQILTDIEQLAGLESQWRALLARSVTNEPVVSPAWLLPWWRVFGTDGRKLCAVTCRDGDRLVGLAPWLARRHMYSRAIPFRRIEPLASGEQLEDETCSDYLDIIVERGYEPAVAEALAGACADHRCDEVVLPAMTTEGPLPRLLADAFARWGFVVDLRETAECHHIPLPASWTDYLARLPTSSRYLMRRSVRDFEAWAKADAQLHVARTPQDLATGGEILRALHAERWGTRGQGGVFVSGRFSQFHDEVQARLLAEGALELSWLAVRGDPVAALYNIRWDRKIYFYQGGRRMDVPKGIRPGIVAHAYAIQKAIEEGCREYDFLAGRAQYKRQLALATRTLSTLRAARPGLRERARIAADRARSFVRSLRDRRIRS